MDDKTFPREDASSPPLLDLDWIKDPNERKEWEEMERLQREIERLNRKAEKELREAGLI